MTTNKPKIVGYIAKRDLESVGCGLELVCIASDPWPGTVALIRLSDYEDLQAENEKLRKDAERYRFLCDPVGADEDCVAHAVNTLNSWADKTEIDQAVDYAILAAAPTVQGEQLQGRCKARDLRLQAEAVAEVRIENGYWNRGHFYEGRRKELKVVSSIQDLPVGTKLYAASQPAEQQSSPDVSVPVDALDWEPSVAPCCGYPGDCWEPCGDLGKSEVHVRVSDYLFNDKEG